MTKNINNLFSLSNSLEEIFNQFENKFQIGSSNSIYYQDSYTTPFTTFTTMEWDIPKILVPDYPVSNGYILSNGALKLEIACTGFDKEELKVKIEDNILIIEGKLKPDEEAEKVMKEMRTIRQDRKELFHNLKIKDFIWKRKVHEKYDMDSLDAELKNGLLEITIQLKEECKPVKKEVEIK